MKMIMNKKLEQIYSSVESLILECSKEIRNIDYDKEWCIKEDGSIVTKYDFFVDNKVADSFKKGVIKATMPSGKENKELVIQKLKKC